MNADRVAAIAAAVLYEGYILYPYRPSALKNQHRFNFGVLEPRGDDEAARRGGTWQMQTECLARTSDATLTLHVRFLHLTARSLERAVAPAEPATASSWQEAIEAEIHLQLAVNQLHGRTIRRSFRRAAGREVGPDVDGRPGSVVRECEQIDGEVDVSASMVADGLSKLTVRVGNVTAAAHAGATDRQAGLMKAMVSTHVLLHLSAGEFVSLLDPPADLVSAAAGCENIGAWPVLVGDEGERDSMLASPIILYDYPQIAQESAADFFDGTEIDEMLVLRILTMTDAEKAEMRASDPRARRLLEHTEALPQEHLLKLHGAMRNLRAEV